MKNLKSAPTTVVSYYHPDFKGSTVAAASEVEVLVGGGSGGGGEGKGGGGSVTVDGKPHVPGDGLNPPPVSVITSSATPVEKRHGGPFSSWASFLTMLLFALAMNGI